MLPNLIEEPLPTAAQLTVFINSAGPSLRRIAVFLLNCDANISETLLLEWEQVDLAAGQIRFGHRLAVIGQRVGQLLERVPHDERTGRVFRDPRRRPYAVDPNRGGNLKTAFREACQRASVPAITPSTLIRVRKIRQMIARFGWDLGDAA